MRQPGLSLTLVGLHRIFGEDLRSWVEVARLAEEVGFDQVALSDHVVMGERIDRYPYGTFPFAPEEPWPEPLTLLAAMAAATRRVRLATTILIAPLRAPVLLAKTVATLDALSGGRIDLGVGVGWQPEEFEALGVPFEKRWTRTDDALRACRALWTDVPASFSSTTVRFERIYCTPRPAQARLPIWFGAAATDALARRVAELGDGWCPLGTAPLADVAPGVQLLRAAFARAGRDPDSLGVRCGVKLVRHADGGAVDWPGTFAAVPSLVAAGATQIAVGVMTGTALTTLDDVRHHLATVAAAFPR